jgi:hypothetical protein
MKYAGVLDGLLGQKVKVKILRHLIFNNAQQSGKEIANAKINHWQCDMALLDKNAASMKK